MKISSLELRRQLFHLLLGVALVLLLHFNVIGLSILLLALLGGIILIPLSMRFRLPFISWFLERFERKDARFPGEGAFFLVFATVLVVAFFPMDIALASLMVLALGDSFAHLLGKAYGIRRFAHKTAFGTLAGIFFGYVGALLFVDPITALLGSGFTMFFEAFNFRILKFNINDNLFIPVVASIIMTIWVTL